MIEPIAASPNTPTGNPPRTQTVEETLPAGFSFEAAMTSLNGRAANSLEVFGATPEANGLSSPQSDKASSAAPAPSPLAARNRQQSAETVTPDRTSAQNSGVKETSVTTPSVTANPLPAAPQSPQINVAASALNMQAQQAPSRNAGQPLNAAATPRAQDLKSEAAKKPAAAPSQTSQKTEDFAKLLAQKLDTGATRFELRLDPPELGKVEAQLNVSDDGDNVVALKFENQASLDLFARDQSGLRAVLAAAGFELGQEQLSFSLSREQEGDGRQSAHAAGLAYNVKDHSQILSSMAAHSRGVVDIWI